MQKIIEYAKNNKDNIVKISFNRHILTIYQKNKAIDFITTNLTNIECQIIIKEFNSLFNSHLTKKSDLKTIDNKLKELGIKRGF